MNSVWLVALLCLGAMPVSDEVTFEAEVLPLLTQLGCNAGACHGAAAGRGQFRLSLWGAEPAADYAALTQAFQGRRVDATRPARSLLLRKPTGDLEHGGGVRMSTDSEPYQVIQRWIAAGSPRGEPVRPRALVVGPARFYFEEFPAAAELRVYATFDGAPPWEVTSLVTFTSLDPTAAEVVELSPVDRAQAAAGSREAVYGVYGVRALRPGQHVVLARYADQVVPFQVVVPFPEMPVTLARPKKAAEGELTEAPMPVSSSDWWDAIPEAEHWIDRPIEGTLRQLGIPASPPAEDAAWLRRLHLDLTGRLPTLDQVTEFGGSRVADKRAQEVDRLLAGEAYVEYWTWKLARWLRLRSLPNEAVAFERYATWLREQVAGDVGLDEVARQLLTAEGDSQVSGPANFSRLVRDPREHAQQVARVFAGIRLECANCHNHPLDRWTQDDFHGLAAVFARVGRGRQVEWLPRGEVTNPRTGMPAVPRLPGQRDLEPGGDGRAEVVAWLLDAEHLYVARVTVNRLWQALFGRGLVEPVDDLRPTNPGTHPQLLEALARDFADHGYRLKHALRQLVLSETYARSAEVLPANQADDRFYSRAYPRVLEPELLVDAIADVTGVSEVYMLPATDAALDAMRANVAGASLPGPTTRAIQLLDGAASLPTADTLGRCSLSLDCGDTASPGGLAAELHLLNGDVINRKLRAEQGRMVEQWRQDLSAHEFVRLWVLRAWSREPSAAELAEWTERLQVEDRDETRRRWEDFAWSLLNSRGFRER